MEWYIKVLKNYANFNGRARRKEYWMFTLFSFIAVLILSQIDEFLLQHLTGVNYHILNFSYRLAVLVPTIAVTARRMHDVGQSGWYMLIPIYNFILAVTKGDKGANEYGPDPKEEQEYQADLLDSELID